MSCPSFRVLALAGMLSSALPAVAATPLEDAKLYGALPKGEGLRLSPDGNQLAMIAARDGRRVMVIWHLGGGDPAMVVPADSEPVWLDWLSDRRLLAGLGIAAVEQPELPYRETRLIGMGLDGGRLVNLYPVLDLDPLTDKMAAMGSGTVVGPQPSSGPGGGGIAAPAAPLVGDTLSQLAFGAATRGTDQFQDLLLTPLPQEREQILLQSWLARSGVGAVVQTDGRGQRPLIWQKSQPGAVDWMADAKGRVRLKVTLDDKERKIWVRDDEDSSWRQVQSVKLDRSVLPGQVVFAPGNLDAGWSWTPVAFSEKSADRLVVAFKNDGGYLALGEADLRDGTLAEIIAQDEARDVTPVLHENRLVGWRAGFGQIVYLDPQYQRLAQVVRRALPGQDIEILDVSQDEKRILLTARPGGEPAVYWMLDRRPKKALLSPAITPYDAIGPDQVAESRLVTVPARDGLKIPAFLTLPKGAQAARMPFVVLLHDGPAAHDTPAFDWLVQFLVHRGYGVLQPQYRGSTGFGVALEQAGDREWGWKAEDDVTDAARWLAAQGLADPARLCVAGRGVGGYEAMMGAVREPRLWRCAASFGGIANLRDFVADRRQDDGIYREINIARIAKPDAERAEDAAHAAARGKDAIEELLIVDRKPAKPEELERISPLFRADEISAPLFLAHGRRDTAVPVAQSEAMEQALLQRGKAVRSLYLPSSGQDLLREEDRVAFLAALGEFLDAQLSRP